MEHKLSNYINNWLKVIENMNNTNTYKLTWGKAILELVDRSNGNIITFADIADLIIKYNWNQMFFFNLRQSPIGQTSIIEQQVQKLIEKYIQIMNSSIPLWWDRAFIQIIEHRELLDVYLLIKREVIKVLPRDVAWRFLLIGKEDYLLYCFDKKSKTVTFTNEQIKELKEYNFVLTELLNFKWAQLLEQFNFAPKIASKVKNISDTRIRRKNFGKIKLLLLSQMKDNKIIDFYTGRELKKDEISFDHVIPWSFMYSDDIWNLVVTSQSYNSSKSNQVPSQETIDKLKIRNEQLYQSIDDNNYKKELQLAIEHNLVDTFYRNMRM